MLHTKSCLKVEYEGKEYQFLCHNNSSLIDVVNVLDQMKSWCVSRIMEVQQAQKPQENQNE